MKSREGFPPIPPEEIPKQEEPSQQGDQSKIPKIPDSKTNDDVPLYSRRDFIRDLAKTAVALSVGEMINLSIDKKKELVPTPGVPAFIYEKSLTNREKYIPLDIIKRIDEAERILQSEEVEYTTTPVPVKSPQPNETPHAQATPKVKVKSGVVLATMDLLNRESETHTLSVDAESNTVGNVEDDGHQIEIGDTALGVGTTYDVTVPEQHLVLATKQYITLKGKPEAVIYSPYSPDLDVPVIRLEGYNYLKNLLTTARQELVKSQVKSRIPGAKEVAQSVPENIALMLTLVEQIDPNIFERKSANLSKQYNLTPDKADVLAAKSMADKALTVVGQNREKARKYARSDKGASGLFQLMPATYQSLGDKDHYPEAKLNKDFGDGATEHINAAKAALLLLDSDLADARDQRAGLINNPVEMGKYLSACYNAGAGAVRQSIQKYGKTWAQNINNETRVYIRKFLAVKALFDNVIPELPELAKTSTDKTLDKRDRSSKRASEDIPQNLKGAASSIVKENEKARVDGIEFIKDMNRLAEMVRDGKVVPLPESAFVKINPNIPSERRYCLPETAKFLTEMATASKNYNSNFEPLMINSSVRPIDVQMELRKKNPNAISNSTHPTGATVDIAYNANPHYKGMSGTQIHWTERYLTEKERSGLIQATEERNQPVFHVMVFKRADK